MKRHPLLFSCFFTLALTCQMVSAQSKKANNPISIQAQIKPDFSKMVDYGIPMGSGVHELPGGKAPVSNQINADGSIKVSRTVEITVPSEKNDRMQSERKKPEKDIPQRKQKRKTNNSGGA